MFTIKVGDRVETFDSREKYAQAVHAYRYCGIAIETSEPVAHEWTHGAVRITGGSKRH